LRDSSVIGGHVFRIPGYQQAKMIPPTPSCWKPQSVKRIDTSAYGRYVVKDYILMG